MAFHPPVHRAFVLALGVIDEEALSYAEAVRRLRSVAARLGIARPSYSTVRRILIAERQRRRRAEEELDRILGGILAGKAPFVLVEHKIVGTGPAGRRPSRAPPQRARRARRSPALVTGRWQAKFWQT